VEANAGGQQAPEDLDAPIQKAKKGLKKIKISSKKREKLLLQKKMTNDMVKADF